ncbi:MAG: hypothetical protein ACP5D2_04050, partial [Candidatus Nanoarchaeia archaeon]
MAVEYLRPSGDDTYVNVENENSSTTNLYQSIDETTVNNSDFIVTPTSGNASDSLYRCTLSNPSKT